MIAWVRKETTVVKHILFIQGAGAGAYEEDEHLTASLRAALGAGYEVHYPAMSNEEDAPYDPWKQHIEQELNAIQEPVILVGHSYGGSVLLKYMDDQKGALSPAGLFLIATPFWGGNGWTYEGYDEIELSKGVAAHLPAETPIVLYHCRDDEVVPFEHLALYAALLPQAQVRELDSGGHQLNNDLSVVAGDIRSRARGR
jgi:uncharacterized protein